MLLNNKELMNTLLAACESAELDGILYDPYAGSEVAEELLAIESMEAMMELSNSTVEAYVEAGTVYQATACEAAGLTLQEMNNFSGDISTESIKNMVKRGAYNVVIAIKKAAKAVVKILVAIFNFFTMADGRFKSYSKLFKKYREKLIKAHTDDTDKSFKYVNVNEVVSNVQAFVNSLADLKYKKLDSSSLENLSNDIVTLCDTLAKKSPNAAEFDSLAKKNIGQGADADKMLADVSKFFSSSEYKDTKADFLRDLKEKLLDRDQDDNFEKAKEALIAGSGKLETATKKDLKFIKEINKQLRDIDKNIDRLSSKTKDQDENQKVIKSLSVTSIQLTEFRSLTSQTCKIYTSAMQAVLADMAKLISAGTRINSAA